MLSVGQSTPSGCLLETSTKTMTHGVLLEGFRHVWFAALRLRVSRSVSCGCWGDRSTDPGYDPVVELGVEWNPAVCGGMLLRGLHTSKDPNKRAMRAAEDETWHRRWHWHGGKRDATSEGCGQELDRFASRLTEKNRYAVLPPEVGGSAPKRKVGGRRDHREARAAHGRSSYHTTSTLWPGKEPNVGPS